MSDLKRRLDELRKAKNTTIVKKDKEYITTGAPQSPHNNSATANCASDQRAPSVDTANEVKLQQSKQEIKTLQDNIAAMKELHRVEIEELKNEIEKQVLFLLSSLHLSPFSGWGNSLIWPIRLCATEQGMNVRVLSLKRYTNIIWHLEQVVFFEQNPLKECEGKQ